MRVALIWERKVDGKNSGNAFPIMSFVNKLLSNYFLTAKQTIQTWRELGNSSGWISEFAVIERWSRFPNSSGKQDHSTNTITSKARCCYMPSTHLAYSAM